MLKTLNFGSKVLRIDLSKIVAIMEQQDYCYRIYSGNIIITIDKSEVEQKDMEKLILDWEIFKKAEFSTLRNQQRATLKFKDFDKKIHKITNPVKKYKPINNAPLKEAIDKAGEPKKEVKFRNPISKEAPSENPVDKFFKKYPKQSKGNYQRKSRR